MSTGEITLSLEESQAIEDAIDEFNNGLQTLDFTNFICETATLEEKLRQRKRRIKNLFNEENSGYVLTVLSKERLVPVLRELDLKLEKEIQKYMEDNVEYQTRAETFLGNLQSYFVEKFRISLKCNFTKEQHIDPNFLQEEKWKMVNEFWRSWKPGDIKFQQKWQADFGSKLDILEKGTLENTQEHLTETERNLIAEENVILKELQDFLFEVYKTKLRVHLQKNLNIGVFSLQHFNNEIAKKEVLEWYDHCWNTGTTAQRNRHQKRRKAFEEKLDKFYVEQEEKQYKFRDVDVRHDEAVSMKMQKALLEMSENLKTFVSDNTLACHIPRCDLEKFICEMQAFLDQERDFRVNAIGRKCRKMLQMCKSKLLSSRIELLMEDSEVSVERSEQWARDLDEAIKICLWDPLHPAVQREGFSAQFHTGFEVEPIDVDEKLFPHELGVPVEESVRKTYREKTRPLSKRCKKTASIPMKEKIPRIGGAKNDEITSAVQGSDNVPLASHDDVDSEFIVPQIVGAPRTIKTESETSRPVNFFDERLAALAAMDFALCGPINLDRRDCRTPGDDSTNVEGGAKTFGLCRSSNAHSTSHDDVDTGENGSGLPKAVEGLQANDKESETVSSDMETGSCDPINQTHGHVIEKIVNKGIYKGVVYYLIQWKGLSEDENLWLREENLNCPDLVREFERERNKSGSKSKTLCRASLKRWIKSQSKPSSYFSKHPPPGYEAEEVCIKRFCEGRVQYGIRWKGLPEYRASWEDAATVNFPDQIKEYENKGYPQKVKYVHYFEKKLEIYRVSWEGIPTQFRTSLPRATAFLIAKEKVDAYHKDHPE